MDHLKAIFYDMDGTLVYFQIDFMAARKAVMSVLTKNGVPENLLNIKETIRVNTTIATDFYKDRMHLDQEKINLILKEVNEKMIEVEKQAALKAKPVEGVEKLLKFCRSKKIKQIVCTYNTHEVAELTLKNAKIIQYFDEIYGRDDVVKAKPDVSHLDPAIKKYSIIPSESVLIGDYTTDIELGKAFGCLTIGVLTEHSLNSVDNADLKVNQSNFSDEVISIIKSKFEIMEKII